MNEIINWLKSDIAIIVIFGINILLLILYIANNIKLSKIRKEYTKFMKDIGKGESIDETLKLYMNDVCQVRKTNEEAINYCRKVDEKMDNCIQKVGLIKYNAFQDTSSNLSFALALLDNVNNGIVLNGIFGRESSNIYAKSVKNGEAESRITKEEELAIEKAINTKNA